jgi:DNA polymerase elongation subunit (family B)
MPFEMQLETGFSIHVCDSDMVSMYPSIMRALNISRMTLRFVPYELEGKPRSELRRYFTNIINVRENAELICSEFMGLPTYMEMLDIVKSTPS